MPLGATKEKKKKEKDLRVTSKSWEQSLANSQQENGDLTPTMAKDWILPATWKSLEVDSSQSFQMSTQLSWHLDFSLVRPEHSLRHIVPNF